MVNPLAQLKKLFKKVPLVNAKDTQGKEMTLKNDIDSPITDLKVRFFQETRKKGCRTTEGAITWKEKKTGIEYVLAIRGEVPKVGRPGHIRQLYYLVAKNDPANKGLVSNQSLQRVFPLNSGLRLRLTWPYFRTNLKDPLKITNFTLIAEILNDAGKVVSAPIYFRTELKDAEKTLIGLLRLLGLLTPDEKERPLITDINPRAEAMKLVIESGIASAKPAPI